MKINAEKSVVKEWLSLLGTASKGSHYPKLWKRVYGLVEVPARKRSKVNLSKIDLNTKDGDNVVVPGKVLSSGEMKHTISIAAIEFSEQALKNLKEANCKIVNIKDMVKSENVRLII